MITAGFLIMIRLLQDRSFEATLLFSMFGLVMSLLLVRLPTLGTALQAQAINLLIASIE
jgi:hypothetical protein